MREGRNKVGEEGDLESISCPEDELGVGPSRGRHSSKSRERREGPTRRRSLLLDGAIVRTQVNR